MAKGLTTAQFSNIANTMDRFGRGIVDRARKNLKKKERRKTASGRWITSNGMASGRLYKSLAYKRKNLNFEISMLGYGESKDQGRNPGNYVDSDRLEEWIRIKPVFPRDEKGRFLPRTPKIMRSLAFLINRSIHDHGVIGSHFFSEAFDFYYKRLDKDVKEAAVKDLDLIFKGRE